MINRIAGRARRVTPLNDTEKRIIKAAAKLFLENGFEKTTFSMISKESGVLRGNIAYYFHAKEDMFFLLVQEMFSFHDTLVKRVQEKNGSKLLSYAYEVMAQISLCEHNPTAWDLYYSIYNHPGTFDFLKDWTASKAHRLLGDLLPDWTEEKFRIVENVASHIEFSALTSHCYEGYSLGDKITLTLDSLMKLYDIDAETRKSVIDETLKLDYANVGQELFDEFLGTFYESMA